MEFHRLASSLTCHDYDVSNKIVNSAAEQTPESGVLIQRCTQTHDGEGDTRQQEQNVEEMEGELETGDGAAAVIVVVAAPVLGVAVVAGGVVAVATVLVHLGRLVS